MRIQDMPTNAPLANAQHRDRWRAVFWCRCGHCGVTHSLDWLLKARPRMTIEGLLARARCAECDKAGRAGEIVEAQLESVPFTSGAGSVYARVIYLAPGRVATDRIARNPLHHHVAWADGG